MHRTIFSKGISFIGTYVPIHDMNEIIKDQYWNFIKEMIKKSTLKRKYSFFDYMNIRMGKKNVSKHNQHV